MDAAKTLDPAALERLRKLGGDKFAGDMIALFLSYGGQKVAEAEAAGQAGDLTGVARALHALKSSAGNVGAVGVQQLAAHAEQAAQSALGDAVAADLAALARAFADLRRPLEAEHARLQTRALQGPAGGLG